MRITLNGLELAKQATDDRSVAQILNEIKEEIKRAGKIVTAVYVDGASVAGNRREAELLNTPVRNVYTLELRVMDPDVLQSQALDDVARLTEAMKNRTETLATKFRVGDEVIAHNELAELLDQVKLIVSCLDHTTRPRGGDQLVSGPRTRVLQAANELLPTLDRIYKAQASGDCIAIADEIEYSLPAHIASWSEITSELLQESENR
jgi:hypothetical protein